MKVEGILDGGLQPRGYDDAAMEARKQEHARVNMLLYS